MGKTRKIVLLALLSAAALCLSYVESLFPLPLPIPGAKLGLGNVMVLLALLLFGFKEASGVLVVKVALSSLLFGSPVSGLYGLCGGILALCGMAFAGRFKSVSVIGRSMLGAVLHNLGQVLLAVILTGTPKLLIYFTFLCFLALVTGALSGVLAGEAEKRLRKFSVFSFQFSGERRL